MIRSLLGKVFGTHSVRAAPAAGPVCLWAGEHSGEPICFLGIERECGHIESGQPACLAHMQLLLRTGGVAVRPAPCFREDCDIVSFARVAFTSDIPGRRLPRCDDGCC